MIATNTVSPVVARIGSALEMRVPRVGKGAWLGRFACVAAVLLAVGCTHQPVSTSSAFDQNRGTFEHLRNLIRVEAPCAEVWTDHYEWTDACNAGACKGAPPRPGTGRPPGVAPRRCDWPYGCGRWEDHAPTPAVLAAICRMPTARARDYLAGMRRIGALRLFRDRTRREITFVMRYQGIIPSGTETDIVWRASAPRALRTGTAAKGTAYAPLAPSGWWLARHWN